MTKPLTIREALTSIARSLERIAPPVAPRVVKVRSANEAVASVQTVAECVASLFNCRVTQLQSRSRAQSITKIRHLAMIACKDYTGASQAEIGRFFRRQHPAVANALSKRHRLSFDLNLIRKAMQRRGHLSNKP